METIVQLKPKVDVTVVTIGDICLNSFCLGCLRGGNHCFFLNLVVSVLFQVFICCVVPLPKKDTSDLCQSPGWET